MEARWLASVHANPTGTARLCSDQPDSQPAWMTPSHASRLHWSHRQQQRVEQQQQQRQSHQQQPQLPSERAAASDTIDVLVACGSLAQQSQWRRVWELSNAAYFDRQHRTLWWRILHGSLMCGAYRVYIAGPPQSRPAALSLVAPTSLKPSATSSLSAQCLPHSPVGFAAFGKP